MTERRVHQGRGLKKKKGVFLVGRLGGWVLVPITVSNWESLDDF